MKRFLINLIGILFSPFLLILLALDIIFGIYLRWNLVLAGSYVSIRVLYRLSNAQILKIYSLMIALRRRIGNPLNSRQYYPLENTHVILNSLSQHGYYYQANYFDFPDNICDFLADLPVKSDIYNTNQISYRNILAAAEDPMRLLSRYFFSPTDILCIPEFCYCVADIRVNNLAKLFLGNSFALVSINAWAILPKSRFLNSNRSLNSHKLASCQAQLFHYDCDWSRSLKIFINISPSSLESAAFVYLPDTHQNLPKFKFKDKRINFDMVRDYTPFFYVADSGSILFADTLGIHRDGDPGSEARYVLQLEFSISPYGNPMTLCKLPSNIRDLLFRAYIDNSFSIAQCQSILRAL